MYSFYILFKLGDFNPSPRYWDESFDVRQTAKAWVHDPFVRRHHSDDKRIVWRWTKASPHIQHCGATASMSVSPARWARMPSDDRWPQLPARIRLFAFRSPGGDSSSSSPFHPFYPFRCNYLSRKLRRPSIRLYPDKATGQKGDKDGRMQSERSARTHLLLSIGLCWWPRYVNGIINLLAANQHDENGNSSCSLEQ